jgi:hypothetical protein
MWGTYPILSLVQAFFGGRFGAVDFGSEGVRFRELGGIGPLVSPAIEERGYVGA